MMKTFEFFAAGEPKGQPRARAVIRGTRAGVFDPGTADGWKSCVKLAAKEVGMMNAKLDGPLQLSLRFFFTRPSGHHKSSNRAKPIKDNAPHYKDGKPDADNAAKAVMDALTDIGAWHDDAQVVVLSARKYYAGVSGSGCLINLSQVEAITHG